MTYAIYPKELGAAHADGPSPDYVGNVLWRGEGRAVVGFRPTATPPKGDYKWIYFADEKDFRFFDDRGAAQKVAAALVVARCESAAVVNVARASADALWKKAMGDA